MEPKDDSNGSGQPKRLFIKDRKQDRVELRFNNLYYTVSLGFGNGECIALLAQVAAITLCLFDIF